MNEKQCQKVIVVCGQTATGKSALAVRIAEKFCGEVVSADSRQVYHGLDIGTGKITEKEMLGVPHHLLDVADPKKQFTVAKFQKSGREKIVAIFSRGKIPIVCGGTGFYIDSLLGRTKFPEVPPNKKLRRRLEKKSAEELFALLKKLNPRRARTIDAKNPRRLVRAIEIAKDADKMRTARGHDAEKKNELKVQSYNTLWIGLTLPPEKLKKKISIRLFARLRRGFGGQARLQPKRGYGGQARLQPKRGYGGQARISRGMITEVKKLHARGLSWKRMEELGLEYRYVSRCLRGFMTEREMSDKLKTEIYRYGKRQMTWFKRNKAIKWFSPSEKKKILKTVTEFLK